MLRVGCKTTFGFSEASLTDDDAYLIGQIPLFHYPTGRYPIPRVHFLQNHAGKGWSAEDEKGVRSMETQLGSPLEQVSIPEKQCDSCIVDKEG